MEIILQWLSIMLLKIILSPPVRLKAYKHFLCLNFKIILTFAHLKIALHLMLRNMEVYKKSMHYLWWRVHLFMHFNKAYSMSKWIRNGKFLLSNSIWETCLTQFLRLQSILQSSHLELVVIGTKIHQMSKLMGMRIIKFLLKLGKNAQFHTKIRI